MVIRYLANFIKMILDLFCLKMGIENIMTFFLKSTKFIFFNLSKTFKSYMLPN